MMQVSDNNIDNDLISEHQKVFKRLKKVLTTAQGFTLILVEYNLPYYRDKIIDLLKKDYNSVINIDSKNFKTYSELERQLVGSNKNKNQLFNLLLTSTEQFNFEGFNIHREYISEQIHHPIILWMSSDDLKLFALTAPDMWAWRKSILNFYYIDNYNFISRENILIANHPANMPTYDINKMRINELKEYFYDNNQQKTNSDLNLFFELGSLYMNTAQYNLSINIYNELIEKEDIGKSLAIEAQKKISDIHKILRNTELSDEYRYQKVTNNSTVHVSEPNPEHYSNLNDNIIELLNELNENEIYLMKHLSIMPLESISLETLLILLDLEKLEITLEGLLRKNLLTKSKDGYVIENIIKVKTLEIYPPTLNYYIEYIIVLNDQLFVDYNAHAILAKLQWVPYGTIIIDIFENEENSLLFILRNNLGRILQNSGKYSISLNYLIDVASYNKRNYGLYDPVTATSYANLGYLYQNIGDITNARIYMGKALFIHEEKLKYKHPGIIDCYTGFGVILTDLGDYKEAEEIYKKGISYCVKEYGEESTNISILYSNLGDLYSLQGYYQESRVYIEKALLISERLLGSNHQATITIYSNLAVTLQFSGEYEQAKILLKKVLKYYEEIFGVYHPLTSFAYSNLGMIYKILGQFPDAKEYLKKSVNIDEKIFGINHQSTAVDYANLALLYADLGQYKKAINLLEQAVLIEEKIYGKEHPTPAIHIFNLGTIYKQYGDSVKSKKLISYALSVFNKTLPAKHPNIVNAKKYLKQFE